ncbi:hypothetical protein ABPG75_013645 [Micractinium tetrahymenae]
MPPMEAGAVDAAGAAARRPAEPLTVEPRDLPSGLSVCTNWLDSSDDDEVEEVAPLSHQSMKSIAAMAGGRHSSTDAGSPDCYPRLSPAHLIAPSLSATQSLEICTSWPAAQKLARSLSMGSPRIAAVPAQVAAPASDAEEGRAASLGSLLRRLSQHLHLGGSSYTLASPAQPPEPAAAASVELAEGDELELLLVGVHSAASYCSLGPLAGTGAAPLPHLSPAHLIAPAQPGVLWQPSPEGLAAQHAAGNSSPLLNTGSDPASSAGQAAPVMDVMQWQLLSQQLEEQQRADWQRERQLGGQQAPALTPDDAVPAAEPEASQTTSATSGCYDPLVAASRYLDSVGRAQATCSSSSSSTGLSPSYPADSASTGGSGWQLLREEGRVRRSLAHPIFELQPQRDDTAEQGRQERRRGRGLLAGLTALVSSQRRAGSPGGCDKAWAVRDSHIQVDLLAEASLCPSPQPAAAWESQALRASWAAPPGAVYASLREQLQQLDMRRAKRTVRAELKRERDAGEAAGQRPRRRSLLERLLPGCFAPQAEGVLPRKLRRALDHQRVHLLCLGRLPYNPDVPLHFELWQAVCSTYASLGASATALGDPFLPPWQALGFSAPNPAAELGDTGLLALLYLLLLADRAPRLAGQLLESSALGLPTAAVAVEATAWALRLLRAGELAREAAQLRSTEAVAEHFFLGATECCLQELLGASQQVRRLPQPRMARAVLALAEERAGAEVAATARRGQWAEA